MQWSNGTVILLVRQGRAAPGPSRAAGTFHLAPLTAYYIGNVLSAVEMTHVNPAAGLYAPLRVVVYENEQGGTTMEYDKPTTMFGQFKSPEIDAMARSLDQRLLAFLTKVST